MLTVASGIRPWGGGGYHALVGRETQMTGRQASATPFLMSSFIEQYGLVQYKPGQRFSQDGAACDINGCADHRARLGDTLEAQARLLRDAGLPSTTGHQISTRADAPLYIDHCHAHGWVRGRICAGCNSVIRFVDKKRCLPRYVSALREDFRRHYNQCPDCEPLAYLLTPDEIRTCQELIYECTGRNRNGVRWAAPELRLSRMERRLRSLPFSGNFAGWLRMQAAACGLTTGDLVMELAQTPYGESDDSGVANVIMSVRERVADLQQAWAGSYEISLDLTVKAPWQAQPVKDRRRRVKAISATGLDDLLHSRSADIRTAPRGKPSSR